MSIYKKIAEAKKEIGAISKSSTTPFFKSKYFDINDLIQHVEPILQKHDLLLLQPLLDGKVVTQIIDLERGEKECSEIALENITDPQKKGSEITYYRRYTLQSLLGLQAEDDDGNIASGNTQPTQQPKKQSKERKTLTKMQGKEMSADWLKAVQFITSGRVKDIARLERQLII